MDRILPILLVVVMGFSLQAKAQGDLLVTPLRIVFDGNKQKEALNLTNMGKDTITYSISLIQYAMKEDGSFAIVENADSALMVATPYLRIFPRRVALASGESQVVMLQYRRSASMVPGEYRSHLYFRSEKNYIPLGLKKNSKDSTLLSVQLIPVYGLSIPVIIRSGETSVTATLSDLKLSSKPDERQNLMLTVNRSGNISTYGDISVEFIPKQGKPVEVGLVRGVGVYTCINRRFISLPLKGKDRRALKHGTLKVQYVSGGEGKRTVYAEGELDI